MKLSQDIEKVTIPGKKEAFRNFLYVLAEFHSSIDIEKVTIPGKKEAFRLYGGDGSGLHFDYS